MLLIIRQKADKDMKKSILPTRPEKADLFKSEIFGKEDQQMKEDEALDKYGRASNASNYSVEALKNEKIVGSKNFNERHISEVVNNGGFDRQKAMIEGLVTKFGATNAQKLERIQKTRERIEQDISETKDREGDTAEGKAIIEALQKMKKEQIEE